MNARLACALFALFALFALLAGSLSAQSQATQRPLNPAYLAAMPPIDRVLNEITGADANDTIARQAGLLWQLRGLVSDIALSQRRTDRQWTPDEKRMFDAYYTAYYAAWHPLELKLAQDKPALARLSAYTADRDFLDQALSQLGATTIQAEYANANAAFAATHQALIERRQTEQSMALAGQAAALKQLQQDMANKVKFEQEKRALVRCVASGRGDSDCLFDALGKDLTEMYPVLKTIPIPNGLSMAGRYTGAGGLALRFYREGVTVGCGAVQEPAAYNIDSRNGQITVTLHDAPAGAERMFTNNALLAQLVEQMGTVPSPTEFQHQTLALALRPDGGFSARRNSPQPATTISVTGPVQIGTRDGTRNVVRDGQPVTERFTEHTYAIKTEVCQLGVLAVRGPSPVLGSDRTATTATFDLLFGGSDGNATKIAPPGPRINGTYRGASGLDIEFHPESAVVSCRDAILASAYTVTPAAAGPVIRVQNGTAPITLTLRPDGTMTGSGSVAVSGRVITGTDANGALAYQNKTDTCALTTLTAQ